MRPVSFKISVLLLLGVLAAGCSGSSDSADFIECRTAGKKAFKAAFQTTVSMPTVRWVQACMEKRGYKRIYDAERCSKLEASIEEAGCYVKG